MNSQKLYQVALSMIPGIGAVLTKHLISYCGSAEAVFGYNKSKLSKIPGIGEKIASVIVKNKNVLDKASKEIEQATKKGVSLLFYTDKAFPYRLKQLYDAPALLYYKGNCDLNAQKIVAIVGSRKATEYGKETVDTIVEGLKKHHPVIVSGLAYGIDVRAHRSALKNNLSTIGIMASGMDIIYPSLHRDTAHKMLESGGLMSENKFGAPPDFHQFPERNRIIAGLADAVVVVEAARKGGALITAEISYFYKRKLFAVPGNINEKCAEGCNLLIKSKKAFMYTQPEDIEDALNWNFVNAPLFNSNDHHTKNLDFTEEENRVVDLLLKNKKEMLIDELSWKSQIPVSQLASLLLNLEFKGYIKSLPGKKFRLN